MKIMRTLLVLMMIAFTGMAFAKDALVPVIKGKVLDENGEPLVAANVYVEGSTVGTTTDEEGRFFFNKIPAGTRQITVRFIGYKQQSKAAELQQGQPAVLYFKLQPDENILTDIEVFGTREKQPEKLNAITRLPLRPSEQIQSISVVSNRLIEEQGNLTITDAVRNVVGVTQFANFGGAQESLSTRGYRGIPVLKNGVRVNSDFRGGGFLMDTEGVESIQVLKGSAAITQGIGSDLGSAGGVVNIATKTPKFVNGGEIGVRSGSWGQFRPSFDIQSVLTKQKNLGFRINGAFERSDSYRNHVSKDRIYVNPSLAWRPDSKTTVTLEMDYLHDTRTPDRGTVNLGPDSVNALYFMPHNKFLGFESDRVISNNITYAARLDRQLSNYFNLRIAYFGSRLDTDNTGATTNTLKNAGKTGDYNLRSRSLTRSTRNDNNSVLQIDLIGQDVFTGKIKHTFQVGFDYRTNSTGNVAYNGVVVDTINVLKDISNVLPAGIKALTAQDPVTARSYSYGLMAQDVVTFNKYLKAVLGVRYSYGNSYGSESAEFVTGDAWNPVAGIIISPIKQLNIFGSYTTTTDLRSASNLMKDPVTGLTSPVGASRSNQFEAGVKSDWFNNRLRFNFTYFHIMNRNLSYSVYNDDWTATGFYDKAGNLKRQGIETELSGRILSNLEVILGYAYLDAQYQDSPAYHEGSAPMNSPRHTANGWAYYTLNKGLLKGLSLGVGAYYVGERPVNEYTYKAAVHNTTPNVKPFDMPAYTTVNAQAAYAFNKFMVRAFFNNIFNSTGYTSYYRGGYINPTDPFNVSASVSYRF